MFTFSMLPSISAKLNFTVVCSSVSATVVFYSFKIVENDTLKGNKFSILTV